LLGNVSLAFGSKGLSSPDVDVMALHAKIGQLTLEIDFLECAPTKVGWKLADYCFVS
jgi:hypothetical protein